MTLRHLILACLFSASLSATAMAHDPSEFLDSLPPAKEKPTTCSELDASRSDQIDTTDAEVKKLQVRCKADAATSSTEDPTKADAESAPNNDE
mgnify:CR=1 FL=1